MSWKLARENYLNRTDKVITRRSARGGYASPVHNSKLGTGTIFDKVHGGNTVLLPNSFESKSELEVMYQELPLAKICVNAIVEDSFKHWRDYKTGESTSAVESFTEEWDRVGASKSLKELAILSRVFGTALGVIVVKDQELDQPLEIDTVTPESLIGLRPFDRFLFHIDPDDIETDLESENFGKPEFYNLITGLAATDGSDQYVPIHHSRIVRLDGEKNLSVASLSYNRLWGLPTLAMAMTEILERLCYRRVNITDSHENRYGCLRKCGGAKKQSQGPQYRCASKTSMFASVDRS